MQVELSTTVFVDDIAKMHVSRGKQGSHERLIKRAVSSTEMLRESLGEGGYSINVDKTVYVVGLRGVGAATCTRRLVGGARLQ